MSVYQRQKCIDTTIAACLLNPLKNEYTYDDLARDILGTDGAISWICLES